MTSCGSTRRWLAALMLLWLTACGQTGPLALPERDDAAAAQNEPQSDEEQENGAGGADER